MHRPPFDDALHAGRMVRVLRIGIVAVLLALAWPGATVWAQTAETRADPVIRPTFREPVTLASRDGVLEVRLTARQGEATLDTVATPVRNFLLFDYEVIRGTASDGKMSGGNLYPAPTLQVFPGERLIVHFGNGLSGLTIQDYFMPQYTPKGQPVPIYPEQMTASPLNLHTHGLHVSPKGNADNVLLHIPPGMSNTYTYDIARNMPQGAYWYHSHLHGLTSAQVYAGLAGLLAIGRMDGNLPLVTEKSIPIRSMALQYNFVFDRAGGAAQLNNPSWPQWVNSITAPKGDELASGTYRPSLAPVNFAQSKPGTKLPVVWYAGSLSIHNNRGIFQFIPGNLQGFIAADGKADLDVPANPSLPDYQRDVQFTVNGQFQPVIESKAGQTEIWVLANVSDMAYMIVQLTETATGRHPPIAIVGQDGNPYTVVHYPPTDNGTRLLIPPASRFAIAVTIPAEGDLILEMPERGGGAKTLTAPGVLYTSNGTDNPPAVLGSISVRPSAVSYADGFFVFPTQVLARATPSQGPGVTAAFVQGQALGAYTSFVDLAKTTPDVKRQILISGGFLNNMASNEDPKSFVYAFDGGAFPNVPLIQARLNSVEEWRFVNHNNDEHPIHVHVNDFQVIEYFDPTTGSRTGPDRFAIDNANAPAPTMGAEESVIEPGILSIRTRFDEFIGLYVMHCHRLNHEDNGLMALVNVIPAVSIYAVAVPGSAGKPAEVRLYDGNGDRFVATIIPFAGFEGSVNVAMGDVDGDGVLDLIVGAGKDHAPEVVAYAGAARGGKGAFGDGARALPGIRGDGAWRCQRRHRADRRDGDRQHHRGIGSRRPERSEGLWIRTAVSGGCRAATLLDIQAVRRGPVRGEHRRRLRGLCDGPRQHCHRARARQPVRSQGVRLSAVESARQGRSDRRAGGGARPARANRFVHSVRQGLSRRRFARDGLVGGRARRRQANRREPTRGNGFGQDLFEWLGARRRAVALSAEPLAAQSRWGVPRDRRLQTIRWVGRHEGGHHQHDDGRQSAGQRFCVGRHERKRSEVRTGQTERPVDDIASRASRPGLDRKGVAASHPRRRLAP